MTDFSNMKPVIHLDIFIGKLNKVTVNCHTEQSSSPSFLRCIIIYCIIYTKVQITQIQKTNCKIKSNTPNKQQRAARTVMSRDYLHNHNNKNKILIERDALLYNSPVV